MRDDGDDDDGDFGGHDYHGPDWLKAVMAMGLIDAGRSMFPDELMDGAIKQCVILYPKPMNRTISNFVAVLPRFTDHTAEMSFDNMQDFKRSISSRLSSHTSRRFVTEADVQPGEIVPLDTYLYYWIRREEKFHYLRTYWNIQPEELAEWADARDRHIEETTARRNNCVAAVERRFRGEIDPPPLW